MWQDHPTGTPDDGLARVDRGTHRRSEEWRHVDEIEVLTELNLRFIEAFRRGSWELLEPILSPSFSYLDGATGDAWDQDRYVQDVRRSLPSLAIDQVVVHVDGDVGMVSARSFTRPGRFNRYVDTYARRADGWICVHACVWPLS
jgi:hypothetical protein